jgi:hypothetical protein
MMRIVHTRKLGRSSIQPMYAPLDALWYLVPATSNAFGGRDYHWEKKLPTGYPTKKSAMQAKRGDTQQEKP